MKKFIISALAVVGLLTAVNAPAQSKKMAAVMIQNHLLEAKTPQETRPTLDPSLFSGSASVARTYEIAKKIPRVLDKQFCYCYCAMNPRFKHKSLLTCYTDGHASKCGTCMNEALIAMKMTEAGKTPKEIADYLQTKYLQ